MSGGTGAVGEGAGPAGRRTGCGQVWLQAVDIRGDEFPYRDVYPFNSGALQRRQHLHFRQNVSFFVGENGSGKSTLLEAVARRCGIHIWAEPRRGGAPQPARGPAAAPARSVMRLTEYLDVTLPRGQVKGGLFSAENFREWTEFLDDVSQIDPGHARYHGGADLTLRSHGEGLLAYFRGRYQIPGLYFLDEPEAALSPASQVGLLRLLAEYRRRGHAQFVIATHSPILMALPEAQVFDFGCDSIRETGYQETAHYRLYRDFMADSAPFLARCDGPLEA